MVELLQRAPRCRSSQVEGSACRSSRPRLRHPAEQGHVHPARRAAPAAAGVAARPEPSDRLLLPLARRGPAGAQHRRDPLRHGLGRHARACAPSRRRRARCSCRRSTSAKFDGMPRSAIDAGLADVVAPVEELPGGSSPIARTRRYIVQPRRPARGQGPERAREGVRPAARPHRQRLLPLQAEAPSIGGSSGAWASTRSTRSRTTSGTCGRTRRRSTCSSRSC